MKVKVITRIVWIISLVSLFTDTASEMLYPIMPLYLQQIGLVNSSDVLLLLKMKEARLSDAMVIGI